MADGASGDPAKTCSAPPQSAREAFLYAHIAANLRPLITLTLIHFRPILNMLVGTMSYFVWAASCVDAAVMLAAELSHNSYGTFVMSRISNACLNEIRRSVKGALSLRVPLRRLD